jgi:hypothetical protein
VQLLFPLLIAAHGFVWMLKIEPALLMALVLSLPAALKFDAQGTEAVLELLG